MTGYEAIAKLNVLSSYDTEKEKREEYKECIYAIIKDLEELHELKKIMGTPIQDIMKRLKVLEEMREHIEVIDYGEKCTYRYYVIIDGNRFDCNKETYDMWSRWLENEKNDR